MSLRPQLELLESRYLSSTTSIAGTVLTVAGGDNADFIQLRPKDIPAGITNIIIDAKAGNDVIDLRGLRIPAEIHAGDGNDKVFGTLAIDKIFGEGGDDWIDGGGQTDIIDGGGQIYDFNARVWAVNGYRPADIRQGHTGDCSFLAVESGLAARNWHPLIAYLGNGFYRVQLGLITENVRFLGYNPAYDPEPAAPGESWVILSQRAWLTYWGQDGVAWSWEVTQAIFGSQGYVQWWSGDVDWQQKIDAALARGQTVVVSTNDTTLSRSLIGDHAYWVVGVYYPGWYLLRNPWGIDCHLPVGVDAYRPWGNPADGYVIVPVFALHYSITCTSIL
jgi:Ca2+-binding RTX toxin-like protein